MGKLFDSDKEELEVGTLVNNGSDPVDIESVNEADDSISIVTENFALVASNLDNVNNIGLSYSSKSVGSVEYFAALETYRPMLMTIANNLGYKANLPALEDYTNTFSTQASHEVCMEGIAEFMKKMWEKLRDLLARFFKKVTEFFKRITKANLDIDTYDKYIPDLIRKIKSNKLTIKDTNLKVNSKLPMMLANPGMEGIDDVFLLNEGILRANKLNEVIYKKVIPGLIAIVSIHVKTLKAELETIKDLDVNPDNLESNLEQFNTRVMVATASILKELTPVPISASELPDEAYESFSSSLNSSSMNNLSLFSLNDPKSSYERLPKNFNMFTALSEIENKTFAIATTEEESTTSEMSPIPVVDGLFRLEELYNKYKKAIDPKKVNQALKANEDAMDELSKFMATTFNAYKENLMKRASLSSSTINLAELANKILENPHPIFDDTSTQYRLFKEHLPVFHEFLLDSNTIGTTKAIELLESNPNGIPVAAKYYGLKVDSGNSLDPKTSMVIYTSVSKLEKFITSVIQSLQVAYRGAGATLLSISVELRYELAKYLYSSATLYS